jgi:hypothetical protein
MKAFLSASLFALVCGLNVASAAPSKAARVADPAKEKACVDVVRNCFARAGQDRSSCFYSSSRNVQCEGTDTGRLSYKRWALDPVPAGNAEPPPAFMGPRLVDQECVSNFDNRWSSMLIKSDEAVASTPQLEAQLESCYKTVSIDIARP